LGATLIAHKGTQGNPNRIKREAEAVEIKPEGDLAAYKGSQGNLKRTNREAEAIAIKPEGDPSSP